MKCRIARNARSLVFPLTWLGCALLVFARRPGMLLDAQPWAEDARIFIWQQLYHGWHSIFIPYQGYYHLVPRVVAMASVHASMALGRGIILTPLLMNLAAVIISSWAVANLARPRFEWIAPLPWRIVAAIGIVLLPASFEVYGNITNIQWWLACYQVLFAWDMAVRLRSPGRWDIAALCASALCGPIGLVPALAGVYLLIRRTADRMSAAAAAVPLCLSFAVEASANMVGRVFAISASNARLPVPELASYALRAVFAGVVAHAVLPHLSATVRSWGFSTVVLLGVAILAVIRAWASPRVRELAPLATAGLIVLGMALLGGLSWLGVFRDPFIFTGGRYVFVPMAVLVIATTFALGRREPKRPVWWAMVGLGVAMLVTDATQFSLPPFANYHWAQEVSAFRPDGRLHCTRPTNPPGWSITFPC